VSSATSGSFTIPRVGHTEANVWYRIRLTVRDSGGLTQTVERDVRPRTVQITLASNPSGRGLTLDGQPVTAPTTVTGVVGIIRTIGAPSPQSAGGTTYTFQSWSDGGSATHDITTPSANTTYTATFAAATPAPSPTATPAPTATPTPTVAPTASPRPSATPRPWWCVWVPQWCR
jgi:hypothetical protein